MICLPRSPLKAHILLTHARSRRMTEVTSNVQVDVCCGLVGSAFKHDIIGRMSYAEPRIKQLFRLVRVVTALCSLNISDISDMRAFRMLSHTPSS